MRVIAVGTLRAFARAHPETESSLTRWHTLVKAADWRTMAEIRGTFPKAKPLNADRVRFEVAGGNFRLVAAINFERRIVFVKFLGSHAEYDAVDVLTVSLF